MANDECQFLLAERPVTNNAVSGVDMALWDIKGKLANMPVYDLLGGKCREAAAVYRHADGKTLENVRDNVLRYKEDGVRHMRIQFGGYGGHKAKESSPENSQKGHYIDSDNYCRDTAALFEYMRKEIGFEMELCHDVHERIQPFEAVRLAKYLEPYRLFFLEDVLSPEQGEYFKMIRSQCSTPLAQGELFNNPLEWEWLIKNRLIDFIRVHISQIGGITPAKKLAVLSEAFGVRTAWHGPGDCSPVGHAANVHLDLCSHNFGIQEWSGIGVKSQEVFPGSPEYRKGYVYLNGNPGLGIEIDEEEAKKYPCKNSVTEWTQVRLVDGTMQKP